MKCLTQGLIGIIDFIDQYSYVPIWYCQSLSSIFLNLLYLQSFSYPAFGECAKYGTCHQVCTQRGASHECSCANGYEMEEDGKSCKANGLLLPMFMGL